MELKEFTGHLKQGILKGETIVFFCNCEMQYSGRAESYLAQGDRIVVIKQDKTVLVHQPEGGMPINYLRAPASIIPNNNNGIISLIMTSGEDRIELTLYRVYSFESRRLIDGLKQELSGNEKDMSDMIKENPNLIGNDFIPLSREEHTAYGFIDVFGHDGEGNLIVVECKRYTASLGCVTQLRRYVEKISQSKGIPIEKVKGVMAAPNISNNAKKMLEDWKFKFVEVEPPKRNEKKKLKQKSLGSF